LDFNYKYSNTWEHK